jgi:hypothetical protein
MHPLPEYPHTAAFGVTRAVAVNTQMIALENGQLNRRKNPQWASVKGTPMDASRSGAAGTRLAALGQASRSVPVTCAVSGRWSAKILNERKLSVTPVTSARTRPVAGILAQPGRCQRLEGRPRRCWRIVWVATCHLGPPRAS